MTHEKELSPEEKKTEKRITLILIIATTIIFLIAIHPLWPASLNAEFPEDSLKIVVTMPMSGGQGEFGVEYARGVQLAVDEINAKGGIHGRLVDPIYYDNLGDLTELQQEFMDTFEEEIPLIIGPLTSSSAIILGMYADMFGVVMITPSATSAELAEYGNYVYRTVSSDSYLGIGMAKIVDSGNLHSIAVVYCGDSYGEGICDLFTEELNTTSPEIVVTPILIDTGTEVDAKGVMEQVAKANATAVFVIPGSPAQVVTLLAEAESRGMDLDWFGTDNTISSEIADYGPYANGFVAVTPSLKINSLTYENKYQKKFGTELKISNSIYGYDTMMLAAQVMQDYGYSAENMKIGMDNVRYLGLTGPIVFDNNGDRYPSYDTIQLINGEWVTLPWSSVLSFGEGEEH